MVLEAVGVGESTVHGIYADDKYSPWEVVRGCTTTPPSIVGLLALDFRSVTADLRAGLKVVSTLMYGTSEILRSISCRLGSKKIKADNRFGVYNQRFSRLKACVEGLVNLIAQHDNV